MQNAILEADQKEAEKACEAGSKVTLSAFDTLAAQDKLPMEIRDLIEDRLVDALVDDKDKPVEKHLREAIMLGYKGLTKESLWAVHCQIGQLEQEDADLLLDITWRRSTPQSARGMNFDYDIGKEVE